MAALRKESVFIPVILTTFYGSEQAAIEAFRLGAKDYIIKPYEVQEMLESVERSLIEVRLRRESLGLKEGVQISQHLEERVRQLHSLCGIGKAVALIHDPNEVLRVVVEAAIYLTNADSGQLFLANTETKQIELRAIRGPSDSKARCVRQPGADQVTKHVVSTGKPLIAERSSSGGDKIPRLAVPVRTSQRMIGVLAVDAKRDYNFNDNDRYLLGILADFAAGAVINTQLIEKLKETVASLDSRPDTVGEAQGSATIPILTDSIVEAERLARELRNLASSAQTLAAKLQVQAGGD
jgi:two-component system NtrC family sensor kinase